MNKLKYIIASLLALMLSGCNSFLELSPKSQVNENGYYKTEEDFTTSMHAVYATLHTIYGPQSLPSYFGECASDNAYCNETAGDYNDKYALTKHQNLTTANAIVLDFWNTYYKAMFKINNVLNKMEGSDFSTKKQIQGECRFIRALYYFDMVRAWGDIPLVLVPVTVAQSYGMARTPTADIYKAIIDDLEFAASNLPPKTSERFAGAATSDAANVLLGKVYLTMGNKEAAKTVLMKEYGKFSLETEYAKLWNPKNKNCRESIFEVQYLGGKSNPYSKYWAVFAPLDNRCVTAWGMGANQVTEDLYQAFEKGDPRREATVQNGYTNTNGDFIADKFFVKWRDNGAELDKLTEAANNNFIILRYADVLLMLTEATGEAKYMNEVRTRAGLPGYGDPNYPTAYNTLEAALQHEEQVEFGGEFHRMFDLLRHGTAMTVINQCSKEHGKITNANQFLLPIPQYVVDQDPTVIRQNDAYK